MIEVLVKYTLVWVGGRPPVPEATLNYVRAEIEKFVTTSGVETPAEVVFHTIYVGNEPEGPAFLVYGKEGDHNNLFVDYIGFVDFEFFRGKP